jgi:hypothetical protein
MTKHGKTTRRGGLTRLADATRAASRPIIKDHGFALPAILCNWPNIVGDSLARDTSPERLSRDGSLTVRVAAPVSTVLQHQEPQILSRIATYFGHRAVHRLKFVRGPLPKRKMRRAPPTRRLDAKEERSLDGLTSRIADPELRAALRRLGRSVAAADTRPA